MKTLIENTIKINGIGHPDTKTIFDTEDRTTFRFKPLTSISGRKLTIHFNYSENDKEVQDKLQMVILISEDENEIKNYIIDTINAYLNPS
jgi:hypothetical protein